MGTEDTMETPIALIGHRYCDIEDEMYAIGCTNPNGPCTTYKESIRDEPTDVCANCRYIVQRYTNQVPLG